MAVDSFNKYLTQVKAGTVIYKTGDMQTDFYIINKGKVQLKMDEEKLVLVTLSKGDFFGEESLNNIQNAIYTTEVIEDAALIKIPYVSLTEMMKQSADISLKILKKLSEKHIRIQEAFVSMLRGGSGLREKVRQVTPKAEEKAVEEIDSDLKAYLVIQRSNRLVQITKTPIFLGRRDYTTGFVPDIDLTTEDEEKYISRKHALILFKDGKFYMAEEPGAINGTYLNGNKLRTGVKYELHTGDELTLCHLNILFKV